MLFSLLTTTLSSEQLLETEGILTSSGSNDINVASNMTTTVSNFFGGIDWSNPSWDLFIILFFVVATLIYGLSLGRDRAIVIIMSIYMSLAVVDYAPFLENIIKDTSLGNLFIFKIVSFLVVFLVLFFFLAQSALINTFSSRNATRSWWQALLFSCLQVGLLISIVLSFLPESATAGLSDFTEKVFLTESSRFLWIIAPIILMILVRKKRARASREIEDYF